MTPENQQDPFNKSLDALHPRVAPSEALVKRMTALAEVTDDARARQRRGTTPAAVRSRLRLAVGAATAAAVAAGIAGGVAVVGPRIALAETLRRVSTNVATAQGFHWRVTFTDGITQEIWFRSPQVWRLDARGQGEQYIEIRTGKALWNYRPSRRIAWRQSEAGQEVGQSLSASVEGFVTRLRRDLDSGKAEDMGMVTRDGQRLRLVAFPSPVQRAPLSAPMPGRTLYWIDTARMLPLAFEQQVQRDGRWSRVAGGEHAFNTHFPETVFTIPKGVRVYDVDTLGVEVGRRFAVPVAAKKFATRTIALRDLQVNAEGDVFVLYTDGSTLDKERQTALASFADDIGTVYAGTAAGIEPFMYHQDKHSSRGITVDKEVMRGFCMVSVLPPLDKAVNGRVWRPRTISLDLSFMEGKGKSARTRHARFSVPVRRPSGRLLPTYADELAALMLAGGSPQQFRESREWGRRVHYYNARDWAGLIATTDRAIREGVVDVNSYLDRAEAFAALGRRDAAQEALAKARTADQHAYYQDSIERKARELRLSVPPSGIP